MGQRPGMSCASSTALSPFRARRKLATLSAPKSMIALGGKVCSVPATSAVSATGWSPGALQDGCDEAACWP